MNNSVSYILRNRPLNYEDKVNIKKLGMPTPDLNIKKTTVGKTREFNRYFKKESAYEKFAWMCGCPERNKLFCFVCLLSNSLQSSPWIQEGVDDLRHLQERATKHTTSATHLNHLVEYSVLGKPDIRKQLDSAYLGSIRAHNEKVDANRHILQRLIMCVKFRGIFELAVRGYDENQQSQNQGGFRGLIDFTSELDSVVSAHLKEDTVFTGTSKTITKELLDTMLQVCKKEILEQITKSNFLAIEVDETTDSFNQQQLVIIFRYVYDGELHERFWSFVKPEGSTAENIARTIINELDQLAIPTNKLIAQSYGGRVTGVPSLIKQKYPKAFYIHCYSHQFNAILEQAASCNKKLKIFFAEIRSFASFFSRTTKGTSVLDEIANRKFPWELLTGWKPMTITALHTRKELIRECLNKILDTEEDPRTISEANGLLKSLNSSDFNYFLEVNRCIIPHVEAVFHQVQSCGADSAYIQNCLEIFETQMYDIQQNKIYQIEPSEEVDDVAGPSGKRIKTEETNQVVAKEFCDVILTQIRDRFEFTGHLSAAKLFSSDLFPAYREDFPEQFFSETVDAYNGLVDKEKLKAELKVIYDRQDMSCNDVLPLLTFINKNNLEEGLSETYKILDIICTTPMITCECERCFFTLKKIKCFLRNTMHQERLDTLAMLSVEQKLIQWIPNFDNKVIDIFVASEKRKKDFMYK